MSKKVTKVDPPADTRASPHIAASDPVATVNAFLLEPRNRRLAAASHLHEQYFVVTAARADMPKHRGWAAARIVVRKGRPMVTVGRSWKTSRGEVMAQLARMTPARQPTASLTRVRHYPHGLNFSER